MQAVAVLWGGGKVNEDSDFALVGGEGMDVVYGEVFGLALFSSFRLFLVHRVDEMLN